MENIAKRTPSSDPYTAVMNAVVGEALGVLVPNVIRMLNVHYKASVVMVIT